MTVYTPKDWGPHGWKFIHFITLGYPNKPTENDKNKYKKFLTSIKDILPCAICQDHYTTNLINFPLTDKVLSSRRNLIYWGIEVHNSVNKASGKKEFSFDEALELIRKDQDTHNNTSKYTIIICILIILTIAYFLWNKYNKNLVN